MVKLVTVSMCRASTNNLNSFHTFVHLNRSTVNRSVNTLEKCQANGCVVTPNTLANNSARRQSVQFSKVLVSDTVQNKALNELN